MIPMVDLKLQYNNLKNEIDEKIIDALGKTQFILGPNVQTFEKEAAAHLGVKHALSCASGTDALHLALLAAGIGEGDEVITTSFTFIATAEAIRYVGATPVYVDIKADTLNIDANLIEAAITEKTRAIVPVHIFGQPADMNKIMTEAKKQNEIRSEWRGSGGVGRSPRVFFSQESFSQEVRASGCMLRYGCTHLNLPKAPRLRSLFLHLTGKNVFKKCKSATSWTIVPWRRYHTKTLNY